ncbi:serine/threonine protein kinase [Streptomyces sp. NPDC057403]|uniref:serine/threonine protein kinase n=1 Tax=Streptomyces sp. NPDC057403 TaxID=3346119 RepID=UPI0036AAE8F3
MTANTSIAGYVLERPFSNEGGGQSEWTFATKNGTSYFIKRFLKPTYPLDDGPGSPATKERKRAQCERFEAHHRAVQRLLNPLSAPGGNLVVTKDFFRHEARYFKVTERVDSSPLPISEVARLPVEDQVSLMLAVSNSIHILHRHSLVHGDLKPDNVLVRRTGQVFATKLIDFDNCFEAGAPPKPDELVGDPAYYSPELMSFLNGDGPGSAIDQASDVFALALVFSQYLTGELPSVGCGGYLSDGLLRAERIRMPTVSADREPIRQLITSMTAVTPMARPSVATVIGKLKDARRRARGLLSTPASSEGPITTIAGRPILKGTGIRTGDRTGAPPALRGTRLAWSRSEDPVEPEPKLRGKLLDRTRKKAEGC